MSLNRLEKVIEALRQSRVVPSGLNAPRRPGVCALYLNEARALGQFSCERDETLFVSGTSNLQERSFETHFSSDGTGFSTVRRSLGAILKEQLHLRALPRAQGSSEFNVKHYRFDEEGEKRLTLWMAENIEVGVLEVVDFQGTKKALIRALRPLLNITGWDNPHRHEIKRLRRICVEEAMARRRVR